VIFTLEALQAEQGDCLLLHFGSDDSPQFVLVDGGPEDVTYAAVLEPRLKQLGARFAGGPLPLPLVVCSHIDDDHIGGLLDLFRAVANWSNDVVKVECLWHNSFSGLFAEEDWERLAAFLARLPDIKRYASRKTQSLWENNITEDTDFMFAVSSVRQGNDLHSLANDARATINCDFSDLVVAPADGVATKTVGGLKLTVIGPDQQLLDQLRTEWKSKKALVGETVAKAAKPDDRRIANLSSVVFLAEYAGRRILMTGDARSDYICEGLERADLLPAGGTLGHPLDILKVQHHGSGHSTSKEFFARAPANNYVISANGKDGNPDDVTLEALVAARGETGYRIWLTNYDAPGRNLRERIDAFCQRHPHVDVKLRAPADPAIRVDLGTTVTY
jgi:hypothetical protein